jgi:hypothetical protein
MILTPQDLIALTGKERTNAQRRVLDHWSLPYKVRTDGTPCVYLNDVEASFGVPESARTIDDHGRSTLTADDLQGMTLAQIDDLAISPGPVALNQWMDKNWQQFIINPDAKISEYRLFSGPSSSGVYFLYVGSELVYIGKADSPAQRLKDHYLSGGKPFTGYAFIEVPRCLTAYVEAPYIDALWPAWNAKTEPQLWSGRDMMAARIQQTWSSLTA